MNERKTLFAPGKPASRTWSRIGIRVAVACLTVASIACQPPPPDPSAADLRTAVRDGDLDLISSILTADPRLIDEPGDDGRYLLHLTHDPAVIRLLLDSGADPFANDARGRSPASVLLVRALRFHGQREDMRAALSAYLDSDVRFPVDGEEGRRTLHLAAEIGHGGLARHLLEAGADPRSLSSTGGTLLHSAAAGGLDSLTKDLIARGFDVDARDRYGLTPLFPAAMEGHATIVHALLAAGATAGIESPAGLNAADYADGYGHAAIVRILADHEVRPDPGKLTSLAGAYLGLDRPGAEPTILAPGILSTSHYDHSAPAFSPDGREVYWGVAYTSRGDYILSMKVRGGRWSVPRIEPFCDPGDSCMYPTLSADGTRLFFTSDRDPFRGESGGGMNIWVAERDGPDWSEPTLIGFDGGHEYGLAIAADGTLYFMADYEGGEGSTDLYRSRLVDGYYSSPENLGPAINSPYYEDEPYVSPDQSFLVFASLRPHEEGEGRLYMSVRNDDDTWGEPRSISSRLGLGGDLRFPGTSPDGRFLFIASNQNGNWDLYWMDASALFPLP